MNDVMYADINIALSDNNLLSIDVSGQCVTLSEIL